MHLADLKQALCQKNIKSPHQGPETEPSGLGQKLEIIVVQVKKPDIRKIGGIVNREHLPGCCQADAQGVVLYHGQAVPPYIETRCFLADPQKPFQHRIDTDFKAVKSHHPDNDRGDHPEAPGQLPAARTHQEHKRQKPQNTPENARPGTGQQQCKDHYGETDGEEKLEIGSVRRYQGLDADLFVPGPHGQGIAQSQREGHFHKPGKMVPVDVRAPGIPQIGFDITDPENPKGGNQGLDNPINRL